MRKVRSFVVAENHLLFLKIVTIFRKSGNKVVITMTE